MLPLYKNQSTMYKDLYKCHYKSICTYPIGRFHHMYLDKFLSNYNNILTVLFPLL